MRRHCLPGRGQGCRRSVVYGVADPTNTLTPSKPGLVKWASLVLLRLEFALTYGAHSVLEEPV